MDLVAYINYLDSNTEEILNVVNKCLPVQLTSKRNGMWSIVEILELICISEKAICIVVSRPSDDIHTEEEIIGSEKLKEATVDLRAQQKLSTSERLRPKGQIENVISFEKLFRE